MIFFQNFYGFRYTHNRKLIDGKITIININTYIVSLTLNPDFQSRTNSNRDIVALTLRIG